MTDVRELIMSRIEAIIAGIAGATTTGRMRPFTSDDELPAVIVYDGAEESDEQNKPRPATSPITVTMTPEIFIQVSADDAADAGSAMNNIRASIIRTILEDAILATLVVNGGNSVWYEGCETSIVQTNVALAEMKLMFAFRYVLSPNQL